MSVCERKRERKRMKENESVKYDREKKIEIASVSDGL